MPVSPTPTGLNAEEAWLPLPDNRFDEAAARHLLRRAGFAAQPDAVNAAVQAGLEATVRRLFGLPWPAFPEPKRCSEIVDDSPEADRMIREAADQEAREKVRREIRDKMQAAARGLGIDWLRRAATPEHSAREKFLLFLSNILVVSRDKVQNPRRTHAYLELLRTGAQGPYPDLLKAMSRNPAMIRYLDLDRSSKGRPNENFARELFELFSLGEGNYTEDDIKQAARAFTGYRQRHGVFRFEARNHDAGAKTVFGQTGTFDGDAVIDLVFKQPAAGRFLPRELCAFYLAEETVPDAYLEPLASFHRNTGYSIPRLTERFFSSRMFFHPNYRGNMIKSPIHFQLGLTQDLGIHVPPFARSLQSLSLMGQRLFDPPNVRGWVGGRLWINASTLAARRSLVEQCFNPVDETKLNADDQAALAEARETAEVHLYVSRDRLSRLVDSSAEAIAERFSQYFLPLPAASEFAGTLRDYIAGARTTDDKISRVRNAAVAVLQSPEYQLC